MKKVRFFYHLLKRKCYWKAIANDRKIKSTNLLKIFKLLLIKCRLKVRAHRGRWCSGKRVCLSSHLAWVQFQSNVVECNVSRVRRWTNSRKRQNEVRIWYWVDKLPGAFWSKKQSPILKTWHNFLGSFNFVWAENFLKNFFYHQVTFILTFHSSLIDGRSFYSFRVLMNLALYLFFCSLITKPLVLFRGNVF